MTSSHQQQFRTVTPPHEVEQTGQPCLISEISVWSHASLFG
jgi:hypothetical protein